MKYVRRFLWFIASRLIIFCMIIGLITVTFYLSMNSANIYVLLSDGLKARAGVVLMKDNPSNLTSFFRREFLDADEVLKIGLSQNSEYNSYTIRSFEHTVSMDWMWSWPWNDTAEAIIIERVPKIESSIKSDYKTMVTEGKLKPYAKWNGGKYRVTLSRLGGQWKIAGMQQLETIVEPDPTPMPTATPKPTKKP